MIPNTIHYCWFGGRPLPKDVLAYIATWKEFFPDFTIKQWDESNFDVNARLYTQQAYYAKKYAFVSDVARLYALVKEGGLYLDTDILIKKTFPPHWFTFSGFGSFEHDHYVETGLIAAEKGNRVIVDFLKIYDRMPFFKQFTFDMLPNVRRFTEYMKRVGFKMTNVEQTINNFTLFPQQLLCGKDWIKGRYDDESTYAVHDYAGSWGDKAQLNLLQIKMSEAFCILKWKLGINR